MQTINERTPSSQMTDKEAILGIADCIQLTLNESNPKESKGSLYQLFTSPLFDIHSVLYYLDKKDATGIVDFLVNQLTACHLSTSFLYLPQIISLILDKAYTEPIENFLLDRCVDQIKFSLLVHWLVSANNSSAFCKRRYDHLINLIEMTLVNGHRPFSHQYSKKMLSQFSDSVILQRNFNKELRLNYFNSVTLFYDSLKQLCEKLKDIQVNRDQALMDHIAQLNKRIARMNKAVTKQSGSSDRICQLFRGILLPFNDYADRVEDEYNNIIVNILPQHSFCFNTKARVPAKLVVECIRVFECEDWEIKYINGSSSESTEETEGVSARKEETKCEVSYYSSMDDFFKQLSIQESELEVKRHQSENLKKINEILSDINYANEHPSEVIKKTDSFFISTNTDKTYLSETSGSSLEIKPFGQKWSEVVSDIKAASSYRNFQSYSVQSFISKANDDLRQELLTMQLIRHFSRIFKEANIPLTLFPYEILITSPTSGLIEFLPNTVSIDSLKKHLPYGMNLNVFFRKFFFDNFEEAQKNFAESLAGYSLITYLLNIKDRHNGNILLDLNGHIIHIDFGFILGISPGNLNFEAAPFKLTSEYVEIMDGVESDVFNYFTSLLTRGFIEIRNRYESCAKLIEIMGKSWDIPCFSKRSIKDVMTQFEQRFHFNISEFDYKTLVNTLVTESLNNWRTVQYDTFQKLTNNIMP